MTVKELYNACVNEMIKGNGDKIIYLSNDDEGNGYHQAYYGFSHNVAELDLFGTMDHTGKEIILG